MRREAVLEEVRSLGRRELELTLAELAPGEREQVLAMVADGEHRNAAGLSFAAFAGLSPWLLRAIDPSRAAKSPPMTPAARQALSEALELLAGRGRAKGPAPVRPGKWLAALFRPGRKAKP